MTMDIHTAIETPSTDTRDGGFFVPGTCFAAAAPVEETAAVVQADVQTIDTGLIVETSDGRIAVSQCHHLDREVDYQGEREAGGRVETLTISGPLHWTRHETAGPLKQAAFHVGMTLVGRWCRGLAHRLLQRRLITGRAKSGIRLTRRFEFHPAHESDGGYALRVIDTIELTDPALRIRRMRLGSDHQTAYVAASGIYQDSVLTPWTDLAQQVERLNADRSVTVRRDLSESA